MDKSANGYSISLSDHYYNNHLLSNYRIDVNYKIYKQLSQSLMLFLNHLT